ncbi:MAG: polysaccharide biosynthesis/export family protein [Hyphomicrobiaceae bacterium]|nr:polysaccharide biosynthesis/export family protein [Hyphomicrobiaceae bacterium]
MFGSLMRGAALLGTLALSVLAAGCAGPADLDGLAALVPDLAPAAETGGLTTQGTRASYVMPPWGAPVVVVDAEMGDEEGPYVLDAGDRLRIFVYGQPNLSRIYVVDQQGRIAVPLIGEVQARGRTTRQLTSLIARRLGSQFVKDPQVTVDIAQSRPFFILGEVRNAGQYPFVSGLTVQSAVAVAGGYADRADERRVRITRRQNGLVEKMDVPPDYLVRPGDEIYVYERWF